MGTYLTRDQILTQLRQRYEPGNRKRFGERQNSARAIAEELGLRENMIRQVLCGAKPVTKGILQALGYDPTPYYRRRG